MLGQDYQPPRFRTIIIAGIIFVIALLLFWLLSDTVKFAGAPFLYLPDKLGLLRQVQSAEIHTIDLVSVPATVDIPRPGRYLVFTGDFELLQLNALSNKNDRPWLLMRALASKEPVMLTSVTRGLRPYDTPLTKGRPIFSFEVATPGTYEFSYPVRRASIALVPDYMTGNEVMISLVYAVQIAAIVLVLGAVSYYRRREFRAWKHKLDDQRVQRQTRGEVFWQNEIRRIEEEQAEKRPK